MRLCSAHTARKKLQLCSADEHLRCLERSDSQLSLRLAAHFKSGMILHE
jgi:hypothetical protein